MAWQVGDPRSGQDLVLMLPRVVPVDETHAERWLQRARKAARLSHPRLAPALEVGLHDGWPYITYELGEYATLADRIGRQGLAADEAAHLASELAHALAYAHDAGAAHRDLQLHAVLVSDKGQPRLLGLELATIDPQTRQVVEAATPQALRQAAEADIVLLGILMHPMLTGQGALDEADAVRVLERLPPQGREIVRLPFSTPRPIPEPLRVIVNRSTDRQERQRYRSARTLARALDGWLQVQSGSQGGALALLLDKIRIAGVLPASPHGAERAARLALMEGNRTGELADVLLEDVALSLELLRAVNTAHVGGVAVADNGVVLTVRRAVAMLGLDGVRRVALALNTWPGPLSEAQAGELAQAMARTRRAAQVAMAVRPPGFDGEVVYLVALLQNLGRLVVQYHFPDEAWQIRRLMQAAALPDDKGEDPGMSEEAAAMAVLGVDLEAVGTAVVRWWGLGDAIVHLMRRHPVGAAVRASDSDDEILRACASCAIEAVDAQGLPAARVQAALQAIVQRYGRVLGLGLRELQEALQPGAAQAPDRKERLQPTPQPPARQPAESRVSR
ncbi:MAG: HDOD domain-containing protein [Rubrivivax sp.]|nr:HDOD domain-containing protein [Rubrivivax sp.]